MAWIWNGCMSRRTFTKPVRTSSLIFCGEDIHGVEDCGTISKHKPVRITSTFRNRLPHHDHDPLKTTLFRLENCVDIHPKRPGAGYACCILRKVISSSMFGQILSFALFSWVLAGPNLHEVICPVLPFLVWRRYGSTDFFFRSTRQPLSFPKTYQEHSPDALGNSEKQVNKSIRANYEISTRDTVQQ